MALAMVTGSFGSEVGEGRGESWATLGVGVTAGGGVAWSFASIVATAEGRRGLGVGAGVGVDFGASTKTGACSSTAVGEG